MPSEKLIKVKELEKVDKGTCTLALSDATIAGAAGKTWKNAISCPVVVRALGGVTPKHAQWLAQIPGK